VLEDTKYDSNNEKELMIDSDGVRRVRALAGEGNVKEIASGSEMRKWVHGAAVRTIGVILSILFLY